MFEHSPYIGDMKVSPEGRCLELLQYRIVQFLRIYTYILMTRREFLTTYTYLLKTD